MSPHAQAPMPAAFQLWIAFLVCLLMPIIVLGASSMVFCFVSGALLLLLDDEDELLSRHRRVRDANANVNVVLSRFVASAALERASLRAASAGFFLLLPAGLLALPNWS